MRQLRTILTGATGVHRARKLHGRECCANLLDLHFLDDRELDSFGRVGGQREVIHFIGDSRLVLSAVRGDEAESLIPDEFGDVEFLWAGGWAGVNRFFA